MTYSGLRLPLISLLVSLALGPTSQARWATQDDMPITMESNLDNLMVRADGSYEIVSETKFAITKEQGLEAMKIVRMTYDPNQQKIEVISAATINGTISTPVLPANIEDKPLASEGQGFSQKNQLSIPFPALQVGSIVSYKTKTSVKAPFIPGQFHFATNFGASHFVKADTAVILSEIPIFVKQRGTEGNVSVVEAKEGALYKLTISLLKPMIRVPKGEPLAAITAETVPEVEISSLQDWGPIANPMNEKLELAFAEALPLDFLKISMNAASKPTPKAKIESVMADLIRTVKYLGDWRTEKGYYLPRTLLEIANSKQGDCKDYSFATAAILRKLGIKANVAWVHRGPQTRLIGMLSGSNRAFDPLTPGMKHFNHAILVAEVDGKQLWLDPTNAVANVGAPFSDIADRKALVLAAGVTTLSQIPPPSHDSVFDTTSYFAFRTNGKADVMSKLNITGSWASELRAQIASIPEDKHKMVFAQATEPPGRPNFLGFPEEIEPGSTEAAQGMNVSQVITYSAEDMMQKTSMGQAFALPPPSPLGRFFIPHNERVTGVNLGVPGVWSRKYILANFSVAGQKPEGCNLDSKWASASRVYEPKSSGMVITDTVKVKASEIQLLEMITPQYTAFQKSIDECFEDALLIFKHQVPGGTAKTLNPIIRDKKKLRERAYDIFLATSQNFSNYVYSKMLLHEQIQNNPRDAAAYGIMAALTRMQGYIKNDEYDPDEIKEAKELIDTALKIDPHQEDAALVEVAILRTDQQYDVASAKLKMLMSQHPDSREVKRSLMRLNLERPSNNIQRANAANQAIQFATEVLADKTVDKKYWPLYYSMLMSAYKALDRRADVAKMHEKMIEADPKSSWALLNYGAFLVDQGDGEKAAEYARKAIKVADVGMAHHVLGKALSMSAVKSQGKNGGLTSLELCSEALEHDRTDDMCLRISEHYYRTQARQKNDPELTKKADAFAEALNAIKAGKDPGALPKSAAVVAASPSPQSAPPPAPPAPVAPSPQPVAGNSAPVPPASTQPASPMTPMDPATAAAPVAQAAPAPAPPTAAAPGQSYGPPEPGRFPASK